MKILITGGGTQTPLDQMRYIGNRSSGRTALGIAHICAQKHEVVLFLAQEVAIPPQLNMRVQRFTTSYDLMDLMRESENENFDLIIHAAAINDYEVSDVYSGDKKLEATKIPSGLESLEIKLKPAPKVINNIKNFHPQAKLIGFKLSGDLSEDEIKASVARVLENSKAQAVIQNNISERKQGIDTFRVYDQTLESEVIDGIDHLSQRILNLGARR